MRLRKREFRVKVHLQAGERPILLGLGFCTIEATAEEARQLAINLADALVRLQDSGLGEC
jgi:hypothetical protein